MLARCFNRVQIASGQTTPIRDRGRVISSERKTSFKFQSETTLVFCVRPTRDLLISSLRFSFSHSSLYLSFIFLKRILKVCVGRRWYQLKDNAYWVLIKALWKKMWFCDLNVIINLCFSELVRRTIHLYFPTIVHVISCYQCIGKIFLVT